MTKDKESKDKEMLAADSVGTKSETGGVAGPDGLTVDSEEQAQIIEQAKRQAENEQEIFNTSFADRLAKDQAQQRAKAQILRQASGKKSEDDDQDQGIIYDENLVKKLKANRSWYKLGRRDKEDILKKVQATEEIMKQNEESAKEQIKEEKEIAKEERREAREAKEAEKEETKAKRKEEQ